MSQTATAATTTEGTAEGTEAHHGVFPPLDAKTFPSQIFWLAIFFALLYLLMSRLVLPRLSAIIEGRTAQMTGDVARAQALKEETEAAVKSYEKALAEARAKATGIAQDTRASLTTEMDAERSALEATLAKKIGDAEAAIEKARTKAMGSIGSVAADTAQEIVAELTGTKVTKADAAKAVSEIKG